MQQRMNVFEKGQAAMKTLCSIGGYFNRRFSGNLRDRLAGSQ